MGAGNKLSFLRALDLECMLERHASFSRHYWYHPYITSAKGWVDGIRKWQFLLMFSTIDVNIGRVVESEKVQK